MNIRKYLPRPYQLVVSFLGGIAGIIGYGRTIPSDWILSEVGNINEFTQGVYVAFAFQISVIIIASSVSLLMRYDNWYNQK